jgi:hypothetical protein
MLGATVSDGFANGGGCNAGRRQVTDLQSQGMRRRGVERREGSWLSHFGVCRWCRREGSKPGRRKRVCACVQEMAGGSVYESPAAQYAGRANIFGRLTGNGGRALDSSSWFVLHSPHRNGLAVFATALSFKTVLFPKELRSPSLPEIRAILLANRGYSMNGTLEAVCKPCGSGAAEKRCNRK